MQKFSTATTVLEHELSELRLLIERQTGVLLETPRTALSQVVTEYLEAEHLGSAQELLGRLRSSDPECESLIEQLLDGTTSFFRHPAAFESLAKVVLPAIEARKATEHPRTIRIWSAGCSSGEEPYSIAMTVCEAVNCPGGGWKAHIVASDIRRAALQRAERGLYPQTELEHVPQHLTQAYFARLGQHFLVKPRLRNLITFAPMNLAKPVYIGRFDCIFCMDVLPHFSAAQRMTLVQRLHLYLEPGGYLFLGQGEKLPAGDLTFNIQKNRDYTIHQKPMAAVAKSGR